MNSFAFSSDRPLRILLSAQNAEFKSHIHELVDRAYQNLHGASIAKADPVWVNAILAAAVQICADSRIQSYSTRALVQVFEDIIRVSEEHLREARRHAAMAANAFYLRETVLDNTLAASAECATVKPAQSTVMSIAVAELSRLRMSSDN
jgi:hypothetical protein